MRFTKVCLIVAGVLILGNSLENRAPAGDRAPAFITSKLGGWEGLLEYWTYKDGALVGAAPKGLKFNTFLCSKKKYGDFELSFQIRLKNGEGNSGVQIRSKIDDPKKFVVAGPQCDMGDSYWGSVYGERFGGKFLLTADTKLVQKVLKKNDFNDYYIKCVGKHVTVKLNGETTVDGDIANMPEAGIIALQIHAGPPMEVIFKDIRFKDLSK